MSVYVDACQKWPTKIRCFKAGSCHLLADTLVELHAFAARLGMRRAWFQAHRRWPHYDLTVGKRAIAVRLGAAEITREQFVELAQGAR